MSQTKTWSRLPGFFALSTSERRETLKALPLSINDTDLQCSDAGLSLIQADCLSENVIATFSLPLSVAVNFVIDGEPALVPMVTEEPSIVAACSKMGKIVSQGGGFTTNVGPSLMRGQIQFYNLRDVDKARQQFLEQKEELLAFAQSLCPTMAERGGGVRAIDIRVLSTKFGPMMVVEPLVDVVDAMGANVVNSLLEALAPRLVPVIEGTLGLRIVSNLCLERMAQATCTIPFQALAFDQSKDYGLEIALKMVAAHAFAEADIYRACTHNKGILNGIDAVALAVGNDFRAIEAAAHAFASCGGYGPLTSFEIDPEGSVLKASLSVPLSVSVVGGIARIHGGVLLAHKILGAWSTSSQKLASVMVSVGLAQCLAAVYALCQEGIQKGHMKLHQKKLLKALLNYY